jgi:hypothetical protein
LQGATDLRAELQACAKWRLAAFYTGTLALCLTMKAIGIFRIALTSAFGEPLFLTIFGLGSLVVFLAPIVVGEYLQLKNIRLHCPHCGQFLASIRAMLRINKYDECRFCRTKLNVPKASQRQGVFDFVVSIGGLAVLTILLFMLRR